MGEFRFGDPGGLVGVVGCGVAGKDAVGKGVEVTASECRPPTGVADKASGSAAAD